MFLLLLKTKSELQEGWGYVANYAIFQKRSLHTFGFVLHFPVNVLHKNKCAEMRRAAVGSLCSQLVELV